MTREGTAVIDRYIWCSVYCEYWFYHDDGPARKRCVSAYEFYGNENLMNDRDNNATISPRLTLSTFSNFGDAKKLLTWTYNLLCKLYQEI